MKSSRWIDLEVSISESNAKIISSKLPTIKGISFQLHQLFLNLLSNGIKFSKPNESPWINISSKIVSQADMPVELIVKNKPYYQITFKDRGIGFEREQASRIFEVFQRLKPAPYTRGTGIGLAIVKKVVTNHDGMVTAESEPNQGAAFHIYLPA